jgi:Tfp pilus assembly PilM family ATPase
VGVAVDDDRGVDAAQAGLGLELLDLDGHAVGELLAELAEQLLAQELGRQEALAAVGDVVGVEDGLAFGQ